MSSFAIPWMVNRQYGQNRFRQRNVRLADYTLGASVEATLWGEPDTGKCETSPSQKGEVLVWFYTSSGRR